MPKRINKLIELLESGQPVYYTGTRELSYDNGKAMAKTWADYITVDMEHGAFDPSGLGEFMRGLVDGGPTNSGHRTPAVITTDLRLNEPRYASLPGILAARKKPIEEMTLEELEIEIEPRVELVGLEQVSSRRAGQRLDTVTQLLECLRDNTDLF